MLATVHNLPLPDQQDPKAPPTGAVAAAHASAPPVGTLAGAAPPETGLPAVSIRLRRVPRWPSGLPRLSRPTPKPLRDEPLNDEPPRTRRRELARLRSDDRGAVTAEYAVVILAAVAFAGLLVAILRSDEVRSMLLQLVQNALGSAG